MLLNGLLVRNQGSPHERRPGSPDVRKCLKHFSLRCLAVGSPASVPMVAITVSTCGFFLTRALKEALRSHALCYTLKNIGSRWIQPAVQAICYRFGLGSLFFQFLKWDFGIHKEERAREVRMIQNGQRIKKDQQALTLKLAEFAITCSEARLRRL